MRKGLRKFIWIAAGVLILLIAWIGFNTFYIWRDYLSGPPVSFIENDDISLGLYPGANRSATVFTNDDLCAITPLDRIETLRDRLKELDVKGTFFVVPNHLGNHLLHAGDPRIEQLERLKADGHEIAQHGFSHYCEKNKGRGVKMGAEMLFLSVEEQVERLEEGRAILTALGFPPRGHRCPCFSGNERTFKALEQLNYLYGSDLDLPPTTLKTILFPSLRRRLMYPYHPFGMKLLEITSQTDPTVRLEKTLMVFKRYHSRGGVFVFLTHLPDISSPESLERLTDFLNYLKGEDTWICTMEELTEWWLTREVVQVKTELAGNTLVITCDNPSPYPLKNIAIDFKNTASDPKKYRIVNGAGGEAAAGDIPPSRRILVNIP
jgi:peptidoglycan/xylan/chitin deacetylase (PgdA/CDA1 family)